MKITTILMAAVVAMAANESRANLTFSISKYASQAGAPYSSGSSDTSEGGGAFLASLSGSTTFNGTTFNFGAGYSAYTTFCLEYNESFSWNTIYHPTLNSGAVNGGVGGQLPGQNFDPLSVGTAYLYRQWFDGLISSSMGSKVQKAIWYLEDEKTDPSYLDPTIAGMLKTYFDGQFGRATTLADWKGSATTGYLGVYALNDGSCVQDELVATAVPEANTIIAGLLVLVPFGFGVVRSVRKNRKA